jgi:hypothetical protein
MLGPSSVNAYPAAVDEWDLQLHLPDMWTSGGFYQ